METSVQLSLVEHFPIESIPQEPDENTEEEERELSSETLSNRNTVEAPRGLS